MPNLYFEASERGWGEGLEWSGTAGSEGKMTGQQQQTGRSTEDAQISTDGLERGGPGEGTRLSEHHRPLHRTWFLTATASAATAHLRATGGGTGRVVGRAGHVARGASLVAARAFVVLGTEYGVACLTAGRSFTLL